MSKIIDNLRAAYQEVQEKLKGGQHKLDHDGDGDIDGKDFAMLRAKKKKKTEENTPGRMSDVDGNDITKKKKKTDEATHASADKKPEKYHDDEGREKTRMVPTKKKKKDKDEGDIDMNPKLEKGGNAASEQKEAYIDVNRGDHIGPSNVGNTHEKDEKAHRDMATKLASSHKRTVHYGNRESVGDVIKMHKAAADQHAKALRAHNAGKHSQARNHANKAVKHGTDITNAHLKSPHGEHRQAGLDAATHSRDAEKRSKASKEAQTGQRESRIRTALKSIIEGDRAKHYKGATKPETMDDKLKGKGAKDMMNQPKEVDDTETKGHDDASKAGRVTKPAKQRNGGDQVRSGDQKIVNPNKVKEAYLSMKKDTSNEDV